MAKIENFSRIPKISPSKFKSKLTFICNWPLWQMDVKNTFLHSDLHETIYMHPPPGYVCAPNVVCHLKKYHYKLKQVSYAWFDKFQKAILKALSKP